MFVFRENSCFCGAASWIFQQPSPPPSPLPPPWNLPTPPPSPGPPGSGTCVNTCRFASDGHCDDGGPGSKSSHCDSCTDCTDCGRRAHCDFGLSPPPPPPGAECKIWLPLSKVQPYCDPPNSGTKWAIDLNIALGPMCGKPTESKTGCCYMPLGYHGGPAFGTNCEDACATAHRVGAASAYCARSDGSHYGNCFCGAAL